MIARASAHRCARAEDGQAIVMVMALVVIVLAFGIAVLSGALSAGQLTTHDARVRRAQQAADAGVQNQLYEQSENNLGSFYNFNGGLLGLSSVLDCLPLQLNANLQVTGLAAAQVSTAGVCPPAVNSATGKTVSPYYTPLDNHAYVESEYLSNTAGQSSAGLSDVEFPEIVSIGCDSASGATCGTSNASNVYSRELAILAPTGPVQAVEGMGNVKISGILSLLGAIHGDLVAGGNLSLPAVSIGVNLSGLALSGILATFSYGGSESGLLPVANNVHLTGGACTVGSQSTFASKPCYIQRPAPTVPRPTPDTLSTICPSCSTGITCTSCGSGAGYIPATDTFSMTSGTAKFATGDYYLCNFNATAGTISAPSSGSGPVRIFVLAPNSPPCSGNGYTETSGSWNGGNFVATPGINNATSGITEGTVSLNANPSAVQIYVEGDGGYDNATSVSIGGTSLLSGLLQDLVIYAPTSSVNVNVCAVLGCLISAAFEGSVVGDNVTINAGVITQDLDLGNYPIYSGANAYRVAEEIHCDGSVASLSQSASADTSGC